MNTYIWSNSIKGVKNINKHMVVDLIRFAPGGISRVEIARKLGLSRAAITSIINDLEEQQLVLESSEPSGGRRSVSLEINPNAGIVLGVDIGATHASVVLANYSARVISEKEIILDISSGPETCLSQVDRLVHDLLVGEGLQLADVNSIGVGVPGPLIIEKGVVSCPPIMPGWDNYPIREHLKSLWGIPISLNNDAELGALGEWAFGAGRGEKHLAYIKIGTGIGAGLMLDGQIYRGATGSAGEIGHITIEEEGPLCTCGNRGCLESLAGGRAISAAARDFIKQGKRTILSEMKKNGIISTVDVIVAAQRGDLVAQEIVSRAGHYLGTAVASLVNLFNPNVIIIGGSVAQIGDLLVEPIRETVNQRSLGVVSKNVRITSALLGSRSCSIGAVVQALSLVLHSTLV
jgi:glucokinase-like ROK family protein